MIIREVSGFPIRIRDVGHATPAPYENRKVVRISGEEALGLGIVKQSTGNTLALAQAVRDVLPQLIAGLPEGMSMKVAFDTSEFISAAIESVYKVLIEALILVVLVIFVFLRSVRATLIPIVTIPISLIGSFFFLYVLGFSINVLTLLGIVLSVGLVVDDAIVMLENIHRHIEAGMNRFEAAMKGAKEIGFAVVAMTITLVAVFTPLVFITGRVGQLFVEFALTVVSAVLVSGFVALTLTPMMCSLLLKRQENHGPAYKMSELVFEKINNGYGAILRVILRGWYVVVGAFVIAMFAMVGLFMQLKPELSPLEDRGVFMAFAIAPEGSTMQYTDRYMKQVAGILGQEVPEIDTLFEVVAPGLERPNPVNFAIGFAILEHWDTRKRNQLDITKQITPKLYGGIPGVLSFAMNPLSLGQSFLSKEIEYVIYGSSYEELQDHVNKVMAKLSTYPGITGLDTDLKLNKPQLRVNIDRDKAASMGISMATIGGTVEALLGGRDVTRYKREGKQYDVVLQMEDSKRRQPTDLTSIYVRARSGQLVQLSNLVTLEETVTPKELNHFNRFRAAVINGNVGPEASLGQVLDFIDSTVAQELPQNVTTDLNGASREYRESGDEMKVTLVLALIFIYLVLAAQFESFVGPLVIMLTVPLGFLGALFAMWLNAKFGDGGTLNIYSRIGLVMLVGLITKNGILIVEFANQLRRAGQEKVEAVLEASTLRLRPILMTALATVLGSLPLALSSGAGSEARRAIGWVIVGGVSIGTLLTLFIIPVAYSLIVRTTPRIRDGT